jgi:hypothetical protein
MNFLERKRERKFSQGGILKVLSVLAHIALVLSVIYFLTDLRGRDHASRPPRTPRE